MTTGGIILCALLEILIIKEVVMQAPLQDNLENFISVFSKIPEQHFPQNMDISEVEYPKFFPMERFPMGTFPMGFRISIGGMSIKNEDPSANIDTSVTTEFDKFKKLESNRKNLQIFSNMDRRFSIDDMSIKNEVSKDPPTTTPTSTSTSTSTTTTKSVHVINMHYVLTVPGMPIIKKLYDSVIQLYWEPSKTIDHLQISYQLEGFVDNCKGDNKIEKNKHWNLYYNGTNNYWIIPKNMNQKYQFRVRARNVYGVISAWNQSGVIDLTEVTRGILTTQHYLTLILNIITVIIIIMLICFIIYNYFFSTYRQKQRKNNRAAIPSLTLAELAAFREASDRNFVQSNIYVSTLQYASDYSALPEIKQEQITLGNSIGSSMFGYIFQGKMKKSEGSDTVSVAIKTLGKDASTRQKTKLLQEAKLMNQLQHKHVLKLLGVCFDVDPPLLVLELMEAGDLLNYLRDSHFMQLTDSTHALRLQDLLAMCEDVARGCCYLEEIHFVHRNLACRNCFVSTKNVEDRVIKIGNFGFAKDIYEDGYYQSDVWAFGVLMWEVTTLGQQPYFTKTNIEVMDYLRAGGRLSKPFNCPSTLYELMLRCWSAADARPSFKVCLETIVALRNNVDNVIINPINVGLTAYECSWKDNSSEKGRDNQLSYQSLNNDTGITTIDVDHIYERLRCTSLISDQNLANKTVNKDLIKAIC
ncbi:proto-oncogene tyrosine-protein kinase ROS-like isoform X2 [Anoplolepis gracilipes]|uniref:proto-oncogene tyrosine-protein kinase ROS-like isoform X2 n=1 Tax=Anoplolepis gracilipes TaxID=354296 RepID=UPI003BA0E0AB